MAARISINLADKRSAIEIQQVSRYFTSLVGFIGFAMAQAATTGKIAKAFFYWVRDGLSSGQKKSHSNGCGFWRIIGCRC